MTVSGTKQLEINTIFNATHLLTLCLFKLTYLSTCFNVLTLNLTKIELKFIEQVTLSHLFAGITSVSHK